MRMSRRKPGIVRTGMVLSVCLIVAAMTSGLTLAIHLLTLEHPADHDSRNCSLCKQLLIALKELMLGPSTGSVHDAPIHCADAPEFIEHVRRFRFTVWQSRAPPVLTGSQQV